MKLVSNVCLDLAVSKLVSISSHKSFASMRRHSAFPSSSLTFKMNYMLMGRNAFELLQQNCSMYVIDQN